MSVYERENEQEDVATNEIHDLLIGYPRQRILEGITIGDVLRDHPRLKDPSSVAAAVDLLEREGKIRVEISGGHDNAWDATRIFLVRRTIPESRVC